ncbi:MULTISPECIES: NAD(P)/FAD-dependent oxidoreductase [Vibrio]|uniref:FAD-dependent oxidoreductase n=1 Tax=Vibrio algicola TaxID=2662262 RepID=A0A5Q0TAE5_9VIBR|nr:MULTISPECIES: NAD(P)-binding protein [Vibrio]MBD1575772.1 NAD(P)-binding protein [Vibrio sp. S11_S32]
MKKIAIVGSGISGLTCAYLLDNYRSGEKFDITVFEKNDYVGGHTATIDITHNGQNHAIDTGFIVFNDRTYPNFNKLLDTLGVNKRATEMSFSVHNRTTGFEYNGNNINSLFAQRRNLFRPRFWRLLLEIIKFNKQCKSLFHRDAIENNQTLGDFLHANSFSDFFAEHYILPMGAAIWSTSLKEMKAFELKFFIQFFYHHGLLNISDRPQWYVVAGGSKSYVDQILSRLTKPVLTQSDIQSVTRHQDSVSIVLNPSSANGLPQTQVFDEVIFACHSDQALALLSDASEDEKAVLGNIPYSRNEVVLHTDTALLPKRKLAWASWNYLLDGDLLGDGDLLSDERKPLASDINKNSKPPRQACVTYNMNILQGFESASTFCVTLNQTDSIDASKIIQKFIYHHPVLNSDSVAAQKQRSKISGKNHTHFVGAYWYSGFHEDGVRSALDVTQHFGVSL